MGLPKCSSTYDGGTGPAGIDSIGQAHWSGGQFAIDRNHEPAFGRRQRLSRFDPDEVRPQLVHGGKEFIIEKADKGSWTPFLVGEMYTARVREISEAGNTTLGKDVLVLSVTARMATNLPPLEAGAELKISTATVPDLRGVRTAISGGSIITRGGKKSKIEEAKSGSSNSYSVRSMFERHPRSAVGFSKTHIYFAEVDGRQRGLSVGMTLEELGEYMAKIGCEEAINLDGGGSATFWYRGRVVNSPCDGTERTVANGLVLVRKLKAAGN